MKSHLECIPCFLRQALQAARFVTEDEKVHESVLRAVLCDVSEMDLRDSPPVMSRLIARRVHKYTGCSDPYLEVKRHFNQYVLDLLPRYREMVEKAEDPLQLAVRLAIAGNVIDFGPFSRVDEAKIEAAIMDALRDPLDTRALAELREAIQSAGAILYLTDNAGEIVFDRLLIEQMPREKVAVAVKGGPTLNDAMRADAEMVGLGELVEVLDNGSDAPGTMLDLCSEAFRKRFHAADLVIAKGQANYETLSEISANLFFLLKVKCPVIAEDMGTPLGSMVVQRNQAERRDVA